jgi:hypothetical protein
MLASIPPSLHANEPEFNQNVMSSIGRYRGRGRWVNPGEVGARATVCRGNQRSNAKRLAPGESHLVSIIEAEGGRTPGYVEHKGIDPKGTRIEVFEGRRAWAAGSTRIHRRFPYPDEIMQTMPHGELLSEFSHERA